MKNLYDENDILEKLPLLYSNYEKAVEVVNTMAEHAELKIMELRAMRQRHEIDRDEYRNTKKVLNRRIESADIMRYHCFERYISRFFDGNEDDLASLMEKNGYAVHSELYIQSGGRYLCGSLLDILFE